MPRVREYFRLGESVGETARARERYWEFAVADVAANWLVGRGPMAKFGGGGDVTRNTYSESENPHNLWLITAQSYGLPGAVLYGTALLSLFGAAVSGRGAMPSGARKLQARSSTSGMSIR